jgi:hypothetical protein
MIDKENSFKFLEKTKLFLQVLVIFNLYSGMFLNRNQMLNKKFTFSLCLKEQ